MILCDIIINQQKLQGITRPLHAAGAEIKCTRAPRAELERIKRVVRRATSHYCFVKSLKFSVGAGSDTQKSQKRASRLGCRFATRDVF
jgi:hypothetical protein